MTIQDAYRIWLNSDSEKSFMEWLESKGLAMTRRVAIMILDFNEVDLVKRKRE